MGEAVDFEGFINGDGEDERSQFKIATKINIPLERVPAPPNFNQLYISNGSIDIHRSVNTWVR